MSSFGVLERKLQDLQKLLDNKTIDAELHKSSVKYVLSQHGLGKGDVTMSQDGSMNSFGVGSDNTDDNSRVEILIHNLSHSDMSLSVNNSSKSLPVGEVLARPKFSHYRDISERLLQCVLQNDLVDKMEDDATDIIDDAAGAIEIIKQPVYSRNQQVSEDGRYPVNELPSGAPIPLGFRLLKGAELDVKVSSLHFREKNLENISESKDICYVNAAYFPLISVLIYKWLSTLESHGNSSNTRKIVILISGRGTPTDTTARIIDNSTKATAKVVQKLLMFEFPSLEVVTLHSQTNLFRYDENIVFVKRELAPIVDQIRNDMAQKFGEKWRDSMGVTLSFADGSSARVSAINQSLRQYKPNYFHFWQLKTFWTESKLCDDDIEVQSFEEISTQPALAVDQTPSTVQMTVAAMQQFRSEFEAVMEYDNDNTDLDAFWLRKTKKPVLAVLLVQKPGSAPKLYRGTNMEVSMPTGSLCAERNVIGSALADDITLKRQDLKMIAVYSAKSLEKKKTDMIISSVRTAETIMTMSEPRRNSSHVSSDTCVPCNNQNSDSTTQRIVESNLTLDITSSKEQERNIALKRRHSDTSGKHPSLESPNAITGPRSPIIQGQKRKILNMPLTNNSSSSNTNEEKTPYNSSTKRNSTTAHSYDKQHAANLNKSNNLTTRNDASNMMTSRDSSDTLNSRSAKKNIRKVKAALPNSMHKDNTSNTEDEYEPENEHFLSAQSDLTQQRPFVSSNRGSVTTTATFVVDEDDMNPLKPCGACNEWLKKIAGVNPQFTVITFTDFKCAGVYQENIVDT